MPVDTAALAEQREAAALAEIEWCCELMIAAATLHDEPLPLDVIDEVLGVRPRRPPRRAPAADSLLAS